MSPLVNSSRPPRVTATRQLIEARSVESVCKAGESVRINFATREGLIAVVVPLHSFNEICRAPRDHHGNPFERERDPAQLVQDASTTPAKKAPARPAEPLDQRPLWQSLPKIGPLTRKGGVSAFQRATLHEAWRSYISDPSLTRDVLAAVLSVSPPTLTKYFRMFAGEPGAPLLKPNGRLA